MIDDILVSENGPGGKPDMKRNLFNVTDTARSIISSLDLIAKKIVEIPLVIRISSHNNRIFLR
jgi:hypothetical protein